MLENEKLNVIECPNCHAEYMPEEIFIPNSFFGKAKYIERDGNYKIIDVMGSTMDTVEHFVCEHCNKPFKISAKVQFNTKPENKFHFDSEYRTRLKKESLFLEEDE